MQILDIDHKVPTRREAIAEAWLTAPADVIDRVRAGTVPKGDPLAASEVAALFGIKQTAQLLPGCHPIGVTGAQVWARVWNHTQIRLVGRVRTTDRTGVEMEALVGVQVAALTVYDMLKGLDPALVIGPVRLLAKSGGQHGDWRAPDVSDADLACPPLC